jgi:ankyrin repeat protein
VHHENSATLSLEVLMNLRLPNIFQSIITIDPINEFNNTELHSCMKMEGLQNTTDLDSNFKKIEGLLKSNCHLNFQNVDGNTPLHLACDFLFLDWQKSYHKKVVELLLKHGAKVDISNNKGMTPLHLLAWYRDDLDLMKKMIENGADVNAQDNEGNTPLHLLAKKRSTFETTFNRDIASFLIENGADIRKVNHSNRNPFHLIVEHHEIDEKTLKFLMKLELNWSISDNNPYHNFLTFKLNEKIYHKAQTTLTIEGINFDLKNHTHIINWIERNTEKLNFYRILYRGENLEEQRHLNQSLLHSASERGYNKFIKKILEKGFNPNIQNEENESPLFNAVKCLFFSFQANNSSNCEKFEEILDLLSRSSEVQSANKTTPFKLNSTKTQQKYEKCIELLLEYGAKTNLKNAAGLNIMDYSFKLAEQEFETKVDLQTWLSQLKEKYIINTEGN